MSQLNVNKITGTTGTTSGAPITISGDTATLGTGTTIASGVTGTLGSGVTFPAGHVIQTERVAFDAAGSARTMTISTTYVTVNLGQGNLELTGITMTEGNLCHCILAGMDWLSVTDNTYATNIEIWDGSTTRFTYEFYSDQDSGVSFQMPLSLNFTFSVPASFSNKTISPRIRHQTGRPSGTSHLQARSTTNDVVYFFLVQEIQQ